MVERSDTNVNTQDNPCCIPRNAPCILPEAIRACRSAPNGKHGNNGSLDPGTGGIQGGTILRNQRLSHPEREGRFLMSRFFTTFAFCFVLHLSLTTGTGDIGVWNSGELATGLILALLVAAIAGPVLPARWASMLSPRRWGLFLVYLAGPFFLAMAKANVDVVYRVITGRINPGIVRIAPGLTNDASTTLLANSITLTPGTLSVEVDEKSNDLYIHWINVDEEALKRMPRDHSSICGGFPEWARRIAG